MTHVLPYRDEGSEQIAAQVFAQRAAASSTSQVADSITDGVTTIAPSQNAVFDALALKADASTVSALVVDSIADSDTTHAPSRNAVFDALALKADASALGSYQPLDATLTALAAANWAANALPIGSGADTLAQTSFAANTFPARASSGNLVAKTITDFGLSLVDDTDASAGRTTLGLGTLATQSGTFSGTSSGTNTGDQTITLTGDVTGSGTGSFAATLATAQPAVHTWALAQTFTVAPVFTDASGTRTALGLGTAAVKATGTSGNTVPLLDGANTWSAKQSSSIADNTVAFALGSTTQPGFRRNGNVLECVSSDATAWTRVKAGSYVTNDNAAYYVGGTTNYLGSGNGGDTLAVVTGVVYALLGAAQITLYGASNTTRDLAMTRKAAKVQEFNNGTAGTYAGVAWGSGSQTVAQLPTASTAGAGARAFVTDATATTFLSTVAGSGSNKVPVVSDGTNWLIG